MKKVIATALLALGLATVNAAQAEDYIIDTEGMHARRAHINFKPLLINEMRLTY